MVNSPSDLGRVPSNDSLVISMVAMFPELSHVIPFHSQTVQYSTGRQAGVRLS